MIKSEWVDITPELASKWLAEANQGNRTLYRRVVSAYASDMTAGRWRQTGESIKFDDDGKLLDGQHRLAACAASGITIRMQVLHGVERLAQEAMDTGLGRRFADILRLRGEPRAVELGAIVRHVWAWKNGSWRRSLLHATNPQLLQTLEEHPEVRELLQPAQECAKGCGIPGSVIGLCMWAFSQIEVRDDVQRKELTEDINEFFARLGDGQLLVEEEPIYELRREVQRINDSKRARGSKILLSALVIKAWNHYRSGSTVTHLRWRTGGKRPERFPEPI